MNCGAMPSPLPAMTDLEERLRAAGGHDERAALIAELARLEARLIAEIAAGLRREEFVLWQSALDAVRAASEMLSSPSITHPRATPRFNLPFQEK
jgi:hypothetical protein